MATQVTPPRRTRCSCSRRSPARSNSVDHLANEGSHTIRPVHHRRAQSRRNHPASSGRHRSRVRASTTAHRRQRKHSQIRDDPTRHWRSHSCLHQGPAATTRSAPSTEPADCAHRRATLHSTGHRQHRDTLVPASRMHAAQGCIGPQPSPHLRHPAPRRRRIAPRGAADPWPHRPLCSQGVPARYPQGSGGRLSAQPVGASHSRLLIRALQRYKQFEVSSTVLRPGNRGGALSARFQTRKPDTESGESPRNRLTDRVVSTIFLYDTCAMPHWQCVSE